MRRSEDFTATVRQGTKAARATVVVHVYPVAGADGAPLVGFVVSKAVGSAVDRNRVKRRLRHLMRGHMTDLPAGSRVVVRALPAAVDASAISLADDLASALRRAGA